MGNRRRGRPRRAVAGGAWFFAGAVAAINRPRKYLSARRKCNRRRQVNPKNTSRRFVSADNRRVSQRLRAARIAEAVRASCATAFAAAVCGAAFRKKAAGCFGMARRGMHCRRRQCVAAKNFQPIRRRCQPRDSPSRRRALAPARYRRQGGGRRPLFASRMAATENFGGKNFRPRFRPLPPIRRGRNGRLNLRKKNNMKKTKRMR